MQSVHKYALQQLTDFLELWEKRCAIRQDSQWSQVVGACMASGLAECVGGRVVRQLSLTATIVIIFKNTTTLFSFRNMFRCFKRHHQPPITCETYNCHFYKLPYIGHYSSYTGRKISSIINKYCKDVSVKIIFSPFKLSIMFSPKDFVPDSQN